MSDTVIIDLLVVEPVFLEIGEEPVAFIGTAQAGPTGPQGPPGDSNIPDASQTTRGLIKIASDAAVETGDNTTDAVVPSTLKNELLKKAPNEAPSLTLIFNNHLI